MLRNRGIQDMLNGVRALHIGRTCKRGWTCDVTDRVIAVGTNIRATLAFEGIAPLHAARTSQRDVPTTLNTYVSCVVMERKSKQMIAEPPAWLKLQ